eukprot:scaffold2893_cov254-Pinguiococcus_pyrenoidosus.AAC.11
MRVAHVAVSAATAHLMAHQQVPPPGWFTEFFGYRSGFSTARTMAGIRTRCVIPRSFSLFIRASSLSLVRSSFHWPKASREQLFAPLEDVAPLITKCTAKISAARAVVVEGLQWRSISLCGSALLRFCRSVFRRVVLSRELSPSVRCASRESSS